MQNQNAAISECVLSHGWRTVWFNIILRIVASLVHMISIVNCFDVSESVSKTSFLFQILTLMNMINPVLNGHAGGEVKMMI